MDERVRTAACSCGELRLQLRGEPDVVAVCHCECCQRRTGSAFGVSAYFRREQVTPSGPEKTYQREGKPGRMLRLRFCPNCGSTVYWEADFRPAHVGVAVGTIFDPDFPAPQMSVWERSKHPWVAFQHELTHFPGMKGP